MQHKLAVITVVYQNYDILKDLFGSLKNQTNDNYHLFISDLSTVRKKITYKQLPCTLISEENLGYAHGVNTGLKEASKHGYTQFTIINSDVLLDNEFVDHNIHSITNHPHSIIGGKIYYAKGFEYHRSRYKENETNKVIWYTGGSVDWQNGLIKHRGIDEVDHGQYDREETTEFVTGCLMSFDQSVVNAVGFWSEKYFLYFEDADYCEWAKRKGVTLIYDPSIVLWHKNAQSTEGSGSKLHQKYQKINRLRFGLKYAPFKTKLFLMKNFLLNK